MADSGETAKGPPATGMSSSAVGGDGLSVEPVVDRRQLVEFLEMPRRIYAGDPVWVEPLLFERLQHLDPRKNPFFAHAEVAYWIARRDGRPVGRISAQVNQAHLRRHNDATGHFGFIEGENSADIFAALLRTAEGWLRARGMRRVLGPLYAVDQRGKRPARSTASTRLRSS